MVIELGAQLQPRVHACELFTPEIIIASSGNAERVLVVEKKCRDALLASLSYSYAPYSSRLTALLHR